MEETKIQWEGGATAAETDPPGDAYCIAAETADYCLYAEKTLDGKWHWSVEGSADDEEAAKRAMAAIVRRMEFRVV